MNARTQHTAHASAMIIDRRHYVTLARNEVLELRVNRATQRHILLLANSVTHMITAELADVVYAAVVRHVARIAKCIHDMRASVYTLRSDIRAIMRAAECSKFAH
jgi:hypothetical protein